MTINISPNSIQDLIGAISRHIERAERTKHFDNSKFEMTEEHNEEITELLKACNLLIHYIGNKQLTVAMPTKFTIKGSRYLDI